MKLFVIATSLIHSLTKRIKLALKFLVLKGSVID